eukprot:11197904-Lingulodinium_polyedra.AAC.1
MRCFAGDGRGDPSQDWQSSAPRKTYDDRRERSVYQASQRLVRSPRRVCVQVFFAQGQRWQGYSSGVHSFK